MKPAYSLLLKTLLPVAIGIGVVAWLMGSEFSLQQFKEIPWTGRAAYCIALACLFVVGREWGMMWRWRVLTDRKLSWWQTFKVTVMCEFTSAVTPTTAGGSALSMVFLKREGIPLGRGASLSMIQLMLDNLFIVMVCPLLLIFVSDAGLFSFGGDAAVADGSRLAFWIVYGGVGLLTVFLFLGALVFPHAIAGWIRRLFKMRWLRRWHEKAVDFGNNMIETGAEIRTRSLRWWVEAMAATVLTWVSRYLVVNALFMGFAPEASQLMVFARQFVVWTLLTVSPTPGGSGVSEWLFATFYGDLLPTRSMALVIAVVWRVITYYIYLIAGCIMLPVWMGRRKKLPDSL